jgi:riboflavin synthase
MFTGLIREKGRVRGVERGSGVVRLRVEAPLLARGAREGDSIAVDGVCLTVTGRAADVLSFDVSPETVRRTTLADAAPGDAVNLEDALPADGRLGGHFVLGHVDGTGTVVSRSPSGETVVYTFRVPEDLARHLVPKGSVAIDGISLTINEVRGTTFTVTLIPHTLSQVTLGDRKPGDRVNIETDLLVKAVDRLTAGRGARR